VGTAAGRRGAATALVPREQEVLDLLARGLSNPEICQQLVITEATAKTHVARILQKLDLRDRVQAVIYAYETGLVARGSARLKDPRARRITSASQQLTAWRLLPRQQMMEPLWSPVVATGGNRLQIGQPQKPQKHAETVATDCDRSPITAHGKEGVSGSSPEEGF
jgi:DNA-binding CsgD family transcriptional regulator